MTMTTDETDLAELFDVEAPRGSKAAGDHTIKDEYDAAEVRFNRTVLAQPKTYDPRVGAASARLTVMRLQMAAMAQLPSQTRRTVESVEYQQFSTPPHYAYAAAWAANLRASDWVLEPSAGTGNLAVYAKVAGCRVTLNELSERRAGLLDGLGIADDPVTRENGEQIGNLLLHTVDVVLMNPPFTTSASRNVVDGFTAATHIESAMKALDHGGRLVAIVGGNMAFDRQKFAAWWRDMGTRYAVRCNVTVPGREYRRQGTTYDTQLVVIDRVAPDGSDPLSGEVRDVTQLIDWLAPIRDRRADRPAGAPPRVKAIPKPAAPVAPVVPAPAPVAPEPVPVVVPVVPVASVKGKAREADNAELTDAVYDTYRPQRLKVEGAVEHPTPLVESSAMASVLPPKPTYNPSLPESLIRGGVLSEPQIEAVVYAGQAHQQNIDDGTRRGFFIGDATGVGKGREICAIILDAFSRGERKAIWISKTRKLLVDAKRDWEALGGDPTDVVPLSRFKTATVVKGAPGPDGKPLEEFASLDIPQPGEGKRMILFTTYATLRKDREHPTKSRLQQVIRWAGEDFEGPIAFDESHAMKNSVVIDDEE